MYWTIETKLSVDNVLNRLHNLTVTEKVFDLENYSDKKFKGVFNENKFKLRLIRRLILNYRIPFTPFIYGNIKPNKNNEAQTLVYLTASVSTGQIIFSILLFIFAIWMISDLSTFGLTNGTDILLYIGLFVFIVIIGIGVFQREAKRIISIIEIALDGKAFKN